MKKLLTYTIMAFLLLSIVMAPSLNDVTIKEEGQMYYYTVSYAKGWQLIPSDWSNYVRFQGPYGANPEVYANSAEDTDWHNSALRFTYFPALNKYFGAYTDENLDAVFVGTTQEEYMSAFETYIDNKDADWLISADWYYFDEPRSITWNLIKSVDSYVLRDEQPNLQKGWNLISIPLHVITEELNWGDCEFEKIYYWDGDQQDWESVSHDLVSLDPMALKFGFVVKAKADCSMALEGSVANAGSPPPLPN